MTARRQTLWALALLGLALACRLPHLDAFLNIDAGAEWFRRTEAFWAALRAGRFEDTYQVHPGVTLMWLSGLSLQAGPGLGATPTPAMVAAGALPVALVTSLLAPGTCLLWRRLVGPDGTFAGLVAGGLLATEPFLVGHSRTMHLDALLTTFAWLGVLLAVISLKSNSFRYAVAAGIALGLAVLTKVAGGAVALGVGLVGGVWLLRGPGRRRRLGVLGVLVASALLTTLVVWPALWVEPMAVLTQLVEGVTGQVDRGHRVFFDGHYYAADPGAGYYLAVVLARLSPEVGVLALLGLVGLLWRPSGRRSAILLILLAFSVLLVAQLTAAKKIDRYVLPFFPLLCLVAAHGVEAVLWRTRRLRLWRRQPPGPGENVAPRPLTYAGLALLLFVPRAARLVDVHPHPIAWTQDWPGRPAGRAVTLGFGEGLREAAEWIAQDSAGRRPRVFTGMYRPCLQPWLASSEREMRDAEYILRYISVIQRGFRSQEYRRTLDGLLHEVVIDGRVFAEIHAGPTYRGPTGRGLSLPWPPPPKAPATSASQ
jgi:hypothetical protein